MATTDLTALITTDDEALRNTPLEQACDGLSAEELIAACDQLDTFRRQSDNLYHRVRALFFLYSIYRFILPPKLPAGELGHLPFEGYGHLLARRFQEAIDEFLDASKAEGRSAPTDTISSALAKAYYELGLQNLADQVRKSVREVRGNQWMFRTGFAQEHPLRLRPELVPQPGQTSPILHERTAVRMDLSHSAWSDIFFLGMDFPDGARVLNISVDLAVHGRDPIPRPPIEACFRIIDEPVIRLSSIDLGASAELHELGEVFDFAKDYLGLLKAAIIAAGIVPIGLEGSGQSLQDLLATVVGEGHGIELVSSVNGIPKGSRLAVSTNLLGALISVCMRATGQAENLSGPLTENERRIVAARAILGEWLGGSGGGWQDSGGVWPGAKVITGVESEEGDPEFGISRGRLLPVHKHLGTDAVSNETRQKLQDSLVLVHGGMAQNVGPILEMVTEKYLLRSGEEWVGRAESIQMFDEILDALRVGDIKELGDLTTRHFFGPLHTIIPWSTTYFTERLIDQAREEFGDDFWGFWMLGGMSGGGMGFIFDPSRKEEARTRMLEIMLEQKRALQHSLPFSMDPVVYEFSINENGSSSTILNGDAALMPPGYYPLVMPSLVREDPRSLGSVRRAEMAAFGRASQDPKLAEKYGKTIQPLVANLFPEDETNDDGSDNSGSAGGGTLDDYLERFGFDPAQHAQIQSDLQSGNIGLSRNRIPPQSKVEDVRPGDVTVASAGAPDDAIAIGRAALENGEVGVITLAAGAASRWTEGAGVVKALHPFCKFGDRHRTFAEIHLAKSRLAGEKHGNVFPPHVITTSYLTNGPISGFLDQMNNYGYGGDVRLSYGRSIGLRMVPMVRDLRFEWEEMPQQVLDDRAEKMRTSLRAALMNWAREAGEGTDYRDNLALQCLHPVGHWYEFPNLLLNGTLAKLLKDRPQLKTLMMHNIDTLGASIDPGLLGLHRQSGAPLSFEVIARRLEDRGGGLARVDGQLRLVEGLAMPREEDEFKLSYYNTLTNWTEIDPTLALFGLTRDDLSDTKKVAAGVREFAAQLPTYVTLKEVKKRWGHGQEDIFPVAQFEKLWGDMSAVDGVGCHFLEVPRQRGQQLKEQSQLDGWLRDGSKQFVEDLCSFG